MTRPLDDALLGFWAATRQLLPHQPKALQLNVRRAATAVTQAAREAAERPAGDPRTELREALDRASAELGWSDVMLIVNAAGRRCAGPTRRAAE
ncbi:hypothetical protein [Thalassobaculum litoreum]|uniref:Uncharacterized protein n=1 Tax=Thalassobaculum litoreum DSM 18839 TaxID=1123362 RepID=A0A8G2BPS2_9PROT|nr:hypothetical protein [Thalassobaculum litoreum]SDG61168.1 hypothetical protein SAMN05660686_05012 [Thalassobaculum litoreum DSM 18839]SDG61648.1 hypothetical protein SAMN05660686_05032 [Thalassobaculum litoreum DSM 18839]